MGPRPSRGRGRSAVRGGSASRSPIPRRAPSARVIESLQAAQARITQEWQDLRKQLAQNGKAGTGGAVPARKWGEPLPHHWACPCVFRRNFAERQARWACGKARVGAARVAPGPGAGGGPSLGGSSAPVRPGLSFAAAVASAVAGSQASNAEVGLGLAASPLLRLRRQGQRRGRVFPPLLSPLALPLPTPC